jgi:sarcosine oxidase
MRPESTDYDVIVVGVGGMGSAALYHLARRGRRVLGLERFDVPNSLGSSHGITRIIRLAYFEDPAYVPLLRRAYELWRELETDAGEQLLHITGSIDAGPPDCMVVAGSLRSCAEHDLPHTILSAAELAERFPGYRLDPGAVAILQPDGGFLLSERCIVAHVDAALAAGADVHARERVVGWAVVGDGVEVSTDRATYRAEQLVLTAGAWVSELAPVPVVAERQVLAWLQPLRPELFTPEKFPVFVLQPDADSLYYGFPVVSIPGFKFGRYHHLRERGNADDLDREPNPEDERVLRAFAERYFPAGAGPVLTLRTCFFENSPDEHFIIDRLPDAPQVLVGAGFSGHGFKFCSVVGEILADLATEDETRHDIEFLRLARLEGAGRLRT